MKFFIIGKNGSGKLEVLNETESLGVRVGREFSNIPKLFPQLYLDPQYEKYSMEDIHRMFESGAYICLNGIEEKQILDSYMYYRGLSFYTFDNSDVMILSPAQICNMNKKLITGEHIVFVWLDGTKDSRLHRHVTEKRTYDFREVEENESRYDNELVKIIYGFNNSSVLYFNNEDPCRVASIIYAINKYPDLLDTFVKNYN